MTCCTLGSWQWKRPGENSILVINDYGWDRAGSAHPRRLYCCSTRFAPLYCATVRLCILLIHLVPIQLFYKYPFYIQIGSEHSHDFLLPLEAVINISWKFGKKLVDLNYFKIIINCFNFGFFLNIRHLSILVIY